MKCRVAVDLLVRVHLFAHKDLLALQVFDGLLDHPAKEFAGELAFSVVLFLWSHSPRSLRIWRFIHHLRDFSASLWALRLPNV
jgi:hypothetical protein